MSDIIEQAVNEWSDEKERKAHGEVDGHNVELIKESYARQMDTDAWKVVVFLNGDDFKYKSKTDLTAGEAQDLFDELCETHGLIENPKGYEVY